MGKGLTKHVLSCNCRIKERRCATIVFGSTGCTGQFVDEELYRIRGEGKKSLKWAAAGRSQSKLDASLRKVDLKVVLHLLG